MPEVESEGGEEGVGEGEGEGGGGGGQRGELGRILEGMVMFVYDDPNPITPCPILLP